MTEAITIKVDNRQVLDFLAQLQQRAQDLTPAMREISEILADLSEEAFAREADPATGQSWDLLSIHTIRRREKTGHWPGQKLRVTGTLAREITAQFGKDFALVGSGTTSDKGYPYGLALQFGHPAGNLPARPFLGLSDAGTDEVLDVLSAFLAGN